MDKIEFEAQRINALHNLNVLDTERDPDFDRITEIVADVFSAPISLVSMVDKDRLFFKSGYGSDAKEMGRKDAFCSAAIECNDDLVVLDALEDERFINGPLVANAPYLRFYAGTPMRTEQGYPVGTLCFVDTEPRDEFGADDMQRLKDLADLTMRILELKAKHSELNYKSMLPTEDVAISQLNELIKQSA